MKVKQRLRQLFLDNASAVSNYRIENKGEDEATVYLYDAIGGWYGISAEDTVKDINKLKAKTIHVRINSPGGDVFDGRAIQTALQQHPAKVIAHVDGLAASAASYIAVSANEVEMAEGAFLMIHRAWGFQFGNAEDMLAYAELLEKVDGTIVKDYQKKTGKDEKEIRDWMEAETWFTADEALENGFIDRVFEGETAENTFNLTAYDNTPDRLKNEQGKEDTAVAEHRKHIERGLALINMGH